ncbi:MAG: GNAT family N-acetyltransferase [Steroidobacteraceae bacterium]
MLQIRRAVLDDAVEVARLANELGYAASASVISMRLAALAGQPGHFVAVAQVQPGTLAGWISAERRLSLESGERVEISGLVVDSTQRRHRIGRGLVNAVERWTAECGLALLVVRSNIVRPESHGFYLSLGYVRSKTQHVYSKTVP